MKQIEQLSDLAASKLHLVKSDIKAIEPQTTIINFAGETFFSLFSEQDVIYEAIYDKLINLGDRDNRSLIQADNFEQDDKVAHYFRHLQNCFERPTPVSVEEDDYLTDLSILKQCLLFIDKKATVMIYKIAKLVPSIDFEDYFSSQEDLQLIINYLPKQ